MKLAHLRILILVFVTGIMLSSCSKDKTSSQPIIGTWTTGTSTVSVMVGTKTLNQYLIDTGGMTAAEAAAYAAIINESLKQAFTGTLQIKADNTYTSTFGGSTDTGTWLLNSDNTKLTMTSGTQGTIVFDVTELSSTKLHLQAVQSVSTDINGDNIPELITVSVDVNFTK